MINLEIRCVSGHYRIPTTVPNMGRTASFPVAPPSTIKGFLESLMGEVGAMEGNRFAYGLASGPTGKGFLLRRDTVWTSGVKVRVPKRKNGEAVLNGDGSPKMVQRHPPKGRPTTRETMFHLVYRVTVEGDVEDRVRDALHNATGGGTYLGESDNPIWWIDESDPMAKWVVPGTAMALPLKSGYGFGKVSPVYRGWDFSDESREIPDGAWIDVEREGDA
jgi:CRISPR-associated Cas5-like protein